MIRTLEYYMSNHLKNQIYDTCKDVVNPATSGAAIGLMCGIWGEHCDPEKLFAFVGDASAFSPFQINYIFSDEAQVNGLEPIDKTLRTCNQPIPGEDKGCSCSDCELSCDIPDFPDEDADFVIVENVDGMVFIMVVVFVLGSIIFLAIVLGSSVLKSSALQRE